MQHHDARRARCRLAPLWLFATVGFGHEAIALPFAYVANQGPPNTVSAYSINSTGTTLTPIAGSPFATGGSEARQIVASPDGKFVYVANHVSGNVSAFSADATTGALTPVAGSPFGAGGTSPAPIAVASSPDGRFVFAANNGTPSNVSVYAVSPTGTLTAVGGSPFGGVAQPEALTVSPDSKFLYVTDGNPAGVAVFSLDAAGALTPVAGSPFASGSAPRAIVASGDGKFVYVADNADVWVYAVDAGGALTPIAGSPFPASGARTIALAPNGKYAYANAGSNGVGAYSIDATTGALTTIAGSPFPAHSQVFSITVTPDGAYAFAADPLTNDISVFSVDTNSGVLSAAASPIAGDGVTPVSIVAINATGAGTQTASSVTLTSSLNPSNASQAVTFTANVSGAGGTPTGVVVFLDNGVALQSNVALNGAATASFSSSALAVGSHAITAHYGGDATFAPSTSPVLTQTVNAVSTSVVLTVSANPITRGQSVTFTASVSGSAPAPSGTVTFIDGAGSLGTVALAGTQAVFATDTLLLGSHSITAHYDGDANHPATTSPALMLVVSAAAAGTAPTPALSPYGLLTLSAALLAVVMRRRRRMR